MHYSIQHDIRYCYEKAVTLGVHDVYLQPCSSPTQVLTQFDLEITPPPERRCPTLDAEGNTHLRLWFPPASTDQLCIRARSEVTTHCSNPFDYLAEDWAIQLPVDYPTTLQHSLRPYLLPPISSATDGEVVHLAESTLQDVDGNLSYFLTALSQRIHEACEYRVRPTGSPWPAGLTWRQRQGSCRDFTVLFMAACRAVGLGARFVSGYQEGDPAQPEQELHAWAEVYVPGGGWRGFDPTLGLAVADRHVAIAASTQPNRLAPVRGRVRPGGISSDLHTRVQIDQVSFDSDTTP